MDSTLSNSNSGEVCKSARKKIENLQESFKCVCEISESFNIKDLKKKKVVKWLKINQTILKRIIIKVNLLISMGGSILESRAKAVENAMVVLVCYSQKYQDSPSCRSEAEYAAQKRRIIIPIKMEENFEPENWLGLILGNLSSKTQIPLLALKDCFKLKLKVWNILQTITEY
ncbi:DgyrCDS14538 [Dimorphilus gyrociliatus]|uniref:DgyrCDS14538 n=1 Tax=Dimorphilus gyrociliatus TaxID=2664684 RepID=A0A7I8WDY6_9ANNE|nr:DgyrCDS14538 [Dimorphilus gyrociliatus]